MFPKTVRHETGGICKREKRRKMCIRDRDIRAEYEYERQIELVFEGQRWFDLRRWKKMYEEYSKPIYGVTIDVYKRQGKRNDQRNHYRL